MLNLKLAGIPVQVNNRFEDLALLCAGYESDKRPLLELAVSDADISLERSMQPGTGHKRG